MKARPVDEMDVIDSPETLQALLGRLAKATAGALITIQRSKTIATLWEEAFSFGACRIHYVEPADMVRDGRSGMVNVLTKTRIVLDNGRDRRDFALVDVPDVLWNREAKKFWSMSKRNQQATMRTIERKRRRNK